MARPRQLRFTREGLYYTVVFLAVLFGALSRQLNLLMLVGCMLGGPLLFSLLYGRFALGSLVVERRLPSHLHAEQSLRVEVIVTNRRRWFGIWALQINDTVEREGAEEDRAPVGVFFSFVAARDTRQAHYEGSLPKRGRYRFGPLRAATRFPLGLIRHAMPVVDLAELLVHPKLGQLNPGWAKLIREHESGSQQISRRGLLEADFYGLREWRPGDSRRWIHWRTSARRGTMVVKQFEQKRSQDLAILVDLWIPDAPAPAELARVETAVSLVATLIAESCRKPGAQLHVELAAAEPQIHTGAGSPIFLREQMDALALVQPHNESTLPKQVGHALALIPAATPTIVVSTRPLNWDSLRAAAAERDSQLDGRQIVEVDVSRSDLSRIYQA